MSRSDACSAALRRALAGEANACSITVVGSVVDRGDAAEVADIDTVVVLDRLTPAACARAQAAVARLSGDELGWPGRRVRLNTTFGPLKFDRPDEVVVHLMIYDRRSHREHVLRSPFTCFDWERSRPCHGLALSAIYPVGTLAPRDFVAARRGLANYVSDLESGTLSFRRLEPSGDTMIEVVDHVELDRRHQGEYAYHIVRNLIANRLKMRTGCNRRWEDAELLDAWAAELDDLADWIGFYQQIRDVKLARGHHFPADVLRRTRAFLDAFQTSLDRSRASALRLRVVRHAETPLSDGTFLGCARDPDVADGAALQPYGEPFDAVYASPLRRAVSTATGLAPAATVRLDARLREIDYGRAEGLSHAELRRHFPHVAAAWERGVDAAFPDGEGTPDVRARTRAFLESLPPGGGRALAVTHNVVMRTLAADVLGLDLRDAYRIPIRHLEALDLCRVDGRWYPDWDTDTKARLIDGYVGWHD